MKRPGYIKRKVPLKSGPSKQKAKRMKAVRQKKPVVEQYRDSRGVAFGDVEFILGKDIKKWPKIKRVKNEPDVLSRFHDQHPLCWMTWTLHPQAHHMASGFTRGKADELCALAALSEEWHSKVNTVEFPLGMLLYLKWRHDKPNTDWVRLTLLFGYFLPDLIPIETEV